MTTRINLISWREDARIKEVNYFKLKLIFFLALAMVVLALWHIVFSQELIVVKKQSLGLQQEQDAIVEKTQGIKQMKEQQAVLQKDLEKIKNLAQQQNRLIQVFTALNQVVTANLYLNQLFFDSQNAKIVGKAGSVAEVKQLVDKLLQINRRFLLSIQKIGKQDNMYDFVLMLTYRGA